MKILLQLVLILLPVQYALCQKVKLDTVIHTSLSRDTAMILYSVIDGSEICTYKHQRGVRYGNESYYSTINANVLDSTCVVMSTPVIYNGKVYFKNGGEYENSEYHATKAISIDRSGTITHYDTDYHSQSFIPIAYRTDSLNLFLVNPGTNESTLFYHLDMHEMDAKENLEFSDVDVWFVTSFRCLASTSTPDPNSDRNIMRLDSNGKWARPHGEISYIVCCNEEYFKHWDHFFAKLYSINNMTLVSKVLSMDMNYPSYVGMNIINGKLQDHYIKSSLNNKEKVIIPYKFIPQLDIQMYRAYTDEILTEKDIEGFDKYELGILRNLLFAKHNYAFKSEFYQAYFNMYDFYGGFKIGKNRESNVDNKLTVADKANIALIRRMEANLK